MQDYIELRNDQLQEYYKIVNKILENDKIDDKTDEVYLKLVNNNQEVYQEGLRKIAGYESSFNPTLNYNYFHFKKSHVNVESDAKTQGQSKPNNESQLTKKFEMNFHNHNEKIITRISKEFNVLQEEDDANQPGNTPNQEIDIILNKQFFYDYSVLIFSCEFLLLNETCLNFGLSFQENNFIYDKIQLNNQKFENKAKNIQVYDEEFLLKNFISLNDSKVLVAKWKNQLNENKPYLNLFTGDFNNPHKNLVFFENKHKKKTINFFNLKKHILNNVYIRSAEELPQESDE